jgi:hypothetical protein
MQTNFVFLLLVLAAGQTPKAPAQSPGTFTATGGMTTPRAFHTATLLRNGKVLIAGGASAELFDPSTGTFAATGNLTAIRSRHTATVLSDGKVLIAGGGGLASAELYDPVTGTFTTTGSMMTPRDLHTATLLRDGRVLIAGGYYWNGRTLSIFTAEIYDPSAGTFSATGSMHNAWGDVASGTLLPDGTVLIGTEVYHPATGTFTDTGHPNHDYAYTATLIMDGRAFIAGGGDSDPGNCISETELYNSATAAFTEAPKMTLCRFGHTATLLPNGVVLLAGGASYDAGPYQANLASVEIYDFSTNTYGWIGNMIEGRQRHTATLLPDGRVLIAGGVGAPGYTTLSSAEIYTPPFLRPSPALLSVSSDGQGAIQHADSYQIVSTANPASAGEALIVYCTRLADESQIPPQVSIGGRMAEVLWFGNTPGYVGLNQINVRVPGGVTPGPAVPVTLTYIGRPSNEVTIGVR